LNASVPITENGKRRKIPKRQVIAKLLVNKAATGDLRAIPLLLNETRIQEGHFTDGTPDEIFDTAEDHKVIDSIRNRLRQFDRDSPCKATATPSDFVTPDASLLDVATQAARTAGDAILEIYRRDDVTVPIRTIASFGMGIPIILMTPGNLDSAISGFPDPGTSAQPTRACRRDRQSASSSARLGRRC
jgi:hypothetical protein